MKYFPNNTTTNFTTHLSREITLNGHWVVGLTEVHIPCTMIHIQRDETEIQWTQCGRKDTKSSHIPYGVYANQKDLMRNINSLHGISEAGIRLVDAKNASGYVAIEGKKCDKEIAESLNFLQMSDKIRHVFGFKLRPDKDWESAGNSYVSFTRGIQRESQMPACLARALPEELFVYTDLCVPYTVGDTQAALLRIVNLNTAKYTYGSTQVKYFSPANYIPLLNNCFRTIEIDIRDKLGRPITFEYGTLTLTLHFKRVS